MLAPNSISAWLMVSPAAGGAMGLICEGAALSQAPGRSRDAPGSGCRHFGTSPAAAGRNGSSERAAGAACFAVGFEGLLGFGVSDAGMWGSSQGGRRRQVARVWLKQGCVPVPFLLDGFRLQLLTQNKLHFALNFTSKMYR